MAQPSHKPNPTLKADHLQALGTHAHQLSHWSGQETGEIAAGFYGFLGGVCCGLGSLRPSAGRVRDLAHICASLPATLATEAAVWHSSDVGNSRRNHKVDLTKLPRNRSSARRMIGPEPALAWRSGVWHLAPGTWARAIRRAVGAVPSAAR